MERTRGRSEKKRQAKNTGGVEKTKQKKKKRKRALERREGRETGTKYKRKEKRERGRVYAALTERLC